MANVLYPVRSKPKSNRRDFPDTSAKHYHVGDSVTYKNRQAKAFQDLLNNVAVAAVHDSFERRDAPKCHPETRLTVQGQILGWAQCDEEATPQKRILWVSGPAGGGKTVIMDTVAHKLKKKGNLAASFFFSSCSSSKACRVKDYFVTTLVYQLIRHESVGRIKCLRKKVLSLIEKDPSIFKKCLKDQMEVLVLQPIRDCQMHLKCQSHHNCRLHSQCHSDSDCESHSDCRSHSACRTRSNSPQTPQIILVDGLDECGATLLHSFNDPNLFAARSSKQHDQTEILSVLLDAVKDAACPFRIILASRQEPGINRFFSSCERHSIHICLDDRYNPDADIALFLTAKFAQIRLRDQHISQLWPGDSVIQLLVRNASGQFIYAATVVRFVATSMDTPQKQLDLVLKLRFAISSNPLELLDDLYAQVLKSSPNPLLALKWLKASNRLDVEGFGPTTTWFWCRLCESWAGEANFLLENLSALLCLYNSDTPTMAWATFYHKSFQDFLTDPQRWRVHFEELNDQVAEQWLTERFNSALEAKSPEVPLDDPYYLDVFNIVTPLYRRALTSTPSSLPIGRKPTVSKRRTPEQLSQPFKGSRSDIIILVLGDSGSGKSSLINRLVGWNHLTVKSKEGPRTTHVQVATVLRAPRQYTEINDALEGRRMVFVEPKELEGDYGGLAHLVRWLEATYRHGLFVRGIMYLHDVSQASEHWKSRRRNLSLIAQLCGDNALSQVALVSTRWEKIHPDIFEERLRSLSELSLGGGLWTPMIAGGASVHHLRPVFSRAVPASQQSPLVMQDPWDPWKIIAPFLTDIESGRHPLLIQDELVNRGLPFEKTTVGRTLGIVPKAIFGGLAGSSREHRPEGVDDENADGARLEARHSPGTVNGLKTWIRRTFSCGT